MKTHIRLSGRYLLARAMPIVFSIALITSCDGGESDRSVVTINHGDLIFEVNGDLRTRITTTPPGTKPIMEDFWPSERIIVENTVIDKFKFEKITEKELGDGLSGKQWALGGIYGEEGLEIVKVLTLRVYDDFPELISTKVAYTNNSGNDVFIKKWVNNGSYDEARKINPNAVVENCPCGTCISYFNMASMNQAVSSDPLSSWQIRHKGKTYKALVPNAAYYGDHVELSDNANDFASSFGVGAVLGTKFTWPKDNPNASDSFLLTPEKEKVWKKWFALYDEKMLSKANYLGDLYDIGYDRPETRVIKKQDVLYYAFYAKRWDGEIELKGLGKNTDYRIRDYFNNIDLGKVSLNDSTINASFKDFLLIEVSPDKPLTQLN